MAGGKCPYAHNYKGQNVVPGRGGHPRLPRRCSRSENLPSKKTSAISWGREGWPSMCCHGLAALPPFACWVGFAAGDPES